MKSGINVRVKRHTYSGTYFCFVNGEERSKSGKHTNTRALMHFWLSREAAYAIVFQIY